MIMGWDLVIAGTCTCPNCGKVHPNGQWEAFSCTHNLNQMMRAAGFGPEYLDGKDCVTAAIALNALIAKLESDPETYTAMNPPNGWGDYKSLILLLKDIHYSATKYPSSTIQVSM